MSIENIQKLFDENVIANYTRQPICFTRGEGSYLWDQDDKKYIDFFPGWAVSGIGHCHPDLVKNIQAQVEKLIHMPNNFYIESQGLLAEKISQHAFKGKSFFINSGAESIESAIKLVRKYGHDSGRYKIISMINSFHGRTMGALSATGQPKYHEGFQPLCEGFVHIPFNDIEVLKQSIDEKTIAILLEPIQGEGGIHVADNAYLKEIRKICDEKDICLILDEVQSGMGRTGKMFAYQHYDIEPDILCLAKTLGGGFPVGAIHVQNKFSKILGPGSHASTFGGNPISTQAALSVFSILESSVLEESKESGQYLRKELDTLALKFPKIIREIRGVGLMLGMELYDGGPALFQNCLKQGVILNCTGNNVIRFMPALNVSKSIIDDVLSIVEHELGEMG